MYVDLPMYQQYKDTNKGMSMFCFILKLSLGVPLSLYKCTGRCC